MDQLVQQADLPRQHATEESAHPETRKLGLLLLSGVVVGSMIGGGAFNLPANMSGAAGLGAIVIAWVVTFTGMLFLANTFRILSDKRPDLKAGIYRCAHAGSAPSPASRWPGATGSARPSAMSPSPC